MQNAVNHIAAACEAADVRHAIICPGSRNAPLTMAFARHPGIQCQSVVDERSAGFIALGMAQRSGLPVAVICTSGSAVVNLYPAVVEAFYQRLPLIIITADRPPELIDQWDGQAIHQPGIFGKHVKASINLPDEYSHPEIFSSTVFEAIKTALYEKRGPVHINVPLREPLYTAIHEKFEYPELPQLLGDIDDDTAPALPDITQLQSVINQYKKVLVVIGQHEPNIELLRVYNSVKGKIPFVCDVLSNHHPKFQDLFHTDMLLSMQNTALKEALQPHVLITFGTSVISKNLKIFLRNYKPKYHFHFSQYGETADPFNTSPVQLIGNPQFTFDALDFTNLDGNYNLLWQQYDDKVKHITKKFLEQSGYNEMTGVARILKSLPFENYLQLSNSMPVRWVSILGFKNESLVTTHANRGVSGIDGCTSTAVGVAYMEKHSSVLEEEFNFVTLLTGDVAFFYDSNALWNTFVTPNLRIVILNNGGGGIFRLIDGPGQMPELEEFVETRHTRTAELMAKDYNVGYTQAANFEELDAALATFYQPSDRPKILEIITDSKITAEAFKRYKQLINELE